MTKKCLKCGYIRQTTDVGDANECPSCGAIYFKVEAAAGIVSTIVEPLSDEERIRLIKERAAIAQATELKNRKPQISSSKPKSHATVEYVQKDKGNIWYAIIGAACVIVLALGYTGAGPFMTIYWMKSAIIEKDSEKLSEYIDFPMLRQNLKDQFNAAMAKQVTTELKGNPFSALAAGLATKMVDNLVEGMITPSGLSNFFEGKQISKQTKDNSSTQEAPKRDSLFRGARYTYDSTRKFSIWMPGGNGEETRFVLHTRRFIMEISQSNYSDEVRA